MSIRNEKPSVERRDRDTRVQPELSHRYASIGIPAVAAAARFNRSDLRKSGSEASKDTALLRRLSDAAA